MVKKEEGVKQKVTLSLDSEVYKKYQKYCEEHAIMLSKRIELMIKGELEWRARRVDRRKRIEVMNE